MFRKFRSHIYLSLVFFVLTLFQQYFFYWFKGIPIVWLTPGKYFGVYLFLLAATFIKPSWLRFVFLSFVMGLNFFQMIHLSYFGTQILPNEFYLFFTQFGEIQGTLFHEIRHILLALVLTLFPLGICFVASKRTKLFQGSRILGVLFCLYFIYNPIRTMVTGNTWGRQPSTRELSGMNVYLSMSYFLGKILPSKLSKDKIEEATNTSTGLNFIGKEASKWDKIIFILGESLTPNQMELFGYERSTTPFLASIKDSPNFFYRRALGGGVSTDIAVAFLLNLGYGDAGSFKAATGNHCLFKLAKEQNFKTRFYSIQSSQQLRYIAPYLCSASLDEYKAMEDIAPHIVNDQAALDRELLPSLEVMLKSPEKQFIMLHHRGSHAPWELRASPEAQKFRENTPIDFYDNSVVEFDLFMKELDQKLSKSKDKVLVVYVSDHGEALGQNGEWGHGRLDRPSFEIPFLMLSYNQNFPEGTHELKNYLTHYNVALLVAKELGHIPNQKAEDYLLDYMIYGNDIDGFAGKAKIFYSPEHTYNFEVIQ